MYTMRFVSYYKGVAKLKMPKMELYMMKVRDYFERVKENLLDMKIGSKSFVIMIVSMVLLSMIFTPFIGIPVIGSYAYERY